MSANNIALENIRKQKELLKEKLGRPDWLKGIGIVFNSDDFIIKINVFKLTPEVKKEIFDATEFVPIYIEEVGNINKLEDNNGMD